MFIIAVTTSFSSAHQLMGYSGDCARLHGHTWKVVARVKVAELDDIGLGYDFRDIKNKLQQVVHKFDHQLINDVPPFDKINPTSENLAKYFYDQLKKVIPSSVCVTSVEVKESETCSVTYIED